jgi:hypothetical protein
MALPEFPTKVTLTQGDASMQVTMRRFERDPGVEIGYLGERDPMRMPPREEWEWEATVTAADLAFEDVLKGAIWVWEIHPRVKAHLTITGIIDDRPRPRYRLHGVLTAIETPTPDKV